MQELKIGTSSVRGVIGNGLTPELAVDFACAFGTWVEAGPVVVGRDTRNSSSMLWSAVVSGLLGPGCEVIDLGIATTPLTSFGVRELGATGGISITGSHNDSRWNALKFIGPDGMLLNAVKSEELLDIYHASAFSTAIREDVPPIYSASEVRPRYLEFLTAGLDSEVIRRRGFRIAMDFCNGAAAPLTTEFLRELGCTLLPINGELTGSFPHPPAPTIAHMADLVEFMGGSGVDLGAALNIDGDRIAFVTRYGRPLSEEYTLPLAAMNRLDRRPGPVVTNLSTSRTINDLADGYDVEVIRTEVGEAYVMDQGLEKGAVLAGEGSGGVAALPGSMTFDGLLTLGMVLELVAGAATELEELLLRLPSYVMRKGCLRCVPAASYRVVDHFRNRFESLKPDCTDGVRVDWEDAWLHVRASNTEPLVRLIVEAADGRRAEELYTEAVNSAQSVIRPS